MNSGLISALIFLVLYPISVKPLTQPLNDDVLGLIVFKADVKDPNVRLATWNEDDDSPCSWEGVGCSPRSNRVTEVVLDGFSLSGRIGRGLFQLQSLRKLSLARNNLTGTISPALARLPNLRFLDLGENDLSGPVPGDFFRQCGPLRGISLAGNRLSGPIPPSLGNCSSLVAVNFSSNQFSGPLPSAIWSLHALRSLDLSHNLLDGEVPQGIEGLYNMRSLDLSVNKLTGNIPDGIGGCPLLKSVDLSENSLSGNLPHSLSNLSYCSYLNLGGNTLTGKIWDWIGDMKSIETLDLSTNKLAGSVPSSIGSLRSLQVLNLYANSLSGSLPESMLNCSSLHTLDLGRNSLTGELPRWFSQLGLEEIRLSGNKLAGSLNAVLSSSEPVLLHSLRVLDVSNNGLFGEIPSSIGQLKELTVLDLSQNQLNGSIPEEIGIAISLNELILDDNSFVGSIPPSIKQCSSLSVLTLSHNELNGPLPSAISKLSNLRTVDLSFNKFSGSLPKQLSDLSHLISFNISHNNFQGELPSGGFFNAIPLSSVAANPSLCGSVTKRDCSTVLPKPIVLNPNSTSSYSETGPVPPTFAHKKIILSISALIAIGAAAFIVVGVIAVAVLNFQVRSSKSRSAAAAAYALSGAGSDDYSSNSPSTDASSGKLVMFSGEPDFSTGTHALLNKDCELGRGGFGAVYRTILGDGKPVAIKKLTVSSLVKSQDDFEREVKKLGKIRHPNLVELNGYYWTPSLQLLIYEYVSGGSLHKHLHEGSNVNSFLSWNDRFNIVLGMAKGLSHLHQLNVIHYNLKSSNILIGEEAGEAKVGDFGLARLLPMLDRYILSSKIQSALGYMAPEFACKTVKITEKCDVYGFGVLVLEVVTGKRPVEYMEDDVIVLCDMVRGALEEGRVEECIDARLQGKFPAEEAIPVVKLGLICTSQVPSNRPDMREVVKILELIRCPSSSEGQEEESN